MVYSFPLLPPPLLALEMAGLHDGIAADDEVADDDADAAAPVDFADPSLVTIRGKLPWLLCLLETERPACWFPTLQPPHLSPFGTDLNPIDHD